MGTLRRRGQEPLTNYVDNLWQASWYFQSCSNYRPNWSGYMQNISKEEYPGQSKIRYLPIIDLNPTKDLFNSFIYSRTSKNSKYCYLVLNIWPTTLNKDSGNYKIKINECFWLIVRFILIGFVCSFGFKSFKASTCFFLDLKLFLFVSQKLFLKENK